jgi:hypothetical protein
MPSISDATTIALDAETQRLDTATTAADEHAECIATAMTEAIANILPGSATFP